MLLEHVQRHHVEYSFMGRREHNRCGSPVQVSTQPVGCRYAPTVTRSKPREAILWHWSDEVVADPTLMVEKILSHHGTDSVTAAIAGAGATRSVTKPPGYGIDTARFQIAAEHVLLHTRAA